MFQNTLKTIAVKRTPAVLLLLLGFSFVTYAAAGKEDSSNVRAAIELVKKPSDGYDSMGSELQVYYRISSVADFTDYKYQKADAKHWEALLNDKKASIYARLCAAYFLLDDNKTARSFVEEQLRSSNLRHRFNAARILEMYTYRLKGTPQEWATNLLIKILENRSLEGAKWESSQNGNFPEGDWMDINLSPIDEICWRLGYLKEKRAIPTLISLVERRVHAEIAAAALGDIGDPQVGPVLVELLNDEKELFNPHLVIGAIGKLKYQPGAPVLAGCLDMQLKFGWFTINSIFDALLEIGDKSVIPDIEKYLQGDIPKESTIAARRVLIQLKEHDPVPGLLNLLQEEPDERWKSDIIQDLARYKNPPAITKLAEIAANSDSAYLRRNAMWALSKVGNRQALLELAKLLDAEFPKELKAEHGWKGKPKDWPKYFRELLPNCLHEATKQEFGTNSQKWRQWIEANVKE